MTTNPHHHDHRDDERDDLTGEPTMTSNHDEHGNRARAFGGDPDWRESALCRQADPEAWFPVQRNRAAAQPALQICRRCPVLVECLADALVNDERHGVLGGTTERDRNRIRRNTAKAGVEPIDALRRALTRLPHQRAANDQHHQSDDQGEQEGRAA